MKLDFSKFRKLSSDKKTTTLVHPHGHKITIAHDSLSPKMKTDLEAIPMHEPKPGAKPKKMMAEGGAVQKEKVPTREELTKDYPGVPFTSWGNDEDVSKTNIPMPKPEIIPEAEEDTAEGRMMQGWSKILDEGKKPADFQSVAQQQANPALGAISQDPIPEAIGTMLAGPAMGAVKAGAKALTPEIEAAIRYMAPEARQLFLNEMGFLKVPTGQGIRGAAQRSIGAPVAPLSTQAPGVAASQLQQLEALYKQAPSKALERQIMAIKNGALDKRYADGGEVDASAPLDIEALPESTPPPATSAPLDIQPVEATTPPPAIGGASMSRAPASAAPLEVEAMSPDRPVATNPGAPLPAQAPIPAPDLVQGYEAQMRGIQQQGAAEGAAARSQADAAAMAQANEQKVINHFTNQYNTLDQERKAFQEDIKNAHINPQHYLQNQDTGQKIATAIGLVLGGMGSGITGTANPALEFLNKQIDRDIAAQQQELGKKESLLSANMRQFGNLRDATEMTRIMQSDIIANEFRKRAAMSSDPIAKARAMQAAGQLEQSVAPAFLTLTMRQSLAGAGKSGADPASFVKFVVPEPHQAAVFKEIERAQDTRRMAETILSSFDQAAHDNTAMKTGAGLLRTPPSVLALHQSMQPTFKDLEGTVRQAAMDNTFHNITPAAGDFDSTIKTKRAALVDYLRSKISAPTAKGFGIDLEQFNSTAAWQQPDDIKNFNGVPYKKVQGGWKKVEPPPTQ